MPLRLKASRDGRTLDLLVIMPTEGKACVRFLKTLDKKMLHSLPVIKSRRSTRVLFSDFRFEKARPDYETLRNAFTKQNVKINRTSLVQALGSGKSFTVIAEITDAEFVKTRVYDKTFSMTNQKIVGSRMTLEGALTLFYFKDGPSGTVMASTLVPFHAMVDRSLEQHLYSRLGSDLDEEMFLKQIKHSVRFLNVLLDQTHRYLSRRLQLSLSTYGKSYAG